MNIYPQDGLYKYLDFQNPTESKVHMISKPFAKRNLLIKFLLFSQCTFGQRTFYKFKHFKYIFGEIPIQYMMITVPLSIQQFLTSAFYEINFSKFTLHYWHNVYYFRIPLGDYYIAFCFQNNDMLKQSLFASYRLKRNGKYKTFNKKRWIPKKLQRH